MILIQYNEIPQDEIMRTVRIDDSALEMNVRIHIFQIYFIEKKE